jgi:hypothetical protein
MLALAKRIGCTAGLLCLLACDNSPASPPKHTSGDTRSDDADGGSDRDHDDDDRDAGDDHRISTGAAGKSSDKPAASSSKPAAGGSGGAGGHAAGKGGSDMKAEGGAGGEKHANDAGHGGEGGVAGEENQGGAGGSDDQSSDTGGGGAAAPDGMQPQAGAPSTQDAIAILWQLLGQTPQGMAADVIRKYLEALGSGDAPASSIEGFLRAIDDQAHCDQGISEQCLAACQVVARSCGVCLIDEDCRNEMVKVCGVLTCR